MYSNCANPERQLKISGSLHETEWMLAEDAICKNTTYKRQTHNDLILHSIQNPEFPVYDNRIIKKPSKVTI